MIKLIRILFFCCLFSQFLSTTVQSQIVNDTIRYIPDNDELDLLVFMNMMGFAYHKFQLNSNTPGYLNIYIEEYLNDTLIDTYQHIESNKDEVAKAYFSIVFPQIDTSTKLLRIYTLDKNDSLEIVRFRIGDFALVKKLNVNKRDFDYSFKLTNFNNNLGPKCEVGKKIPLMYYATAIDKDVDGTTVTAFCDIPNILNNRHLIENQNQIKHYFIIGIELVNEI